MCCVAASHWVGRAQAKTCYGEQSGEQNDALEVIHGAAPLRFGISGNNARTIEPAVADDNDFAESEGFPLQAHAECNKFQLAQSR
jgi:hypothetical protein